MIDSDFWMKQDLLKIYKSHKLRYNLPSVGMTFSTVSLSYAIFYTDYIRRIPFSLQFVFIVMIFKIYKYVFLNMRNPTNDPMK